MNQSGARDRILGAARDVVRTVGVDAVRMEDIAGRAGVARPNLYRYFAGRDALVKEVLLTEVRAIHDRRRSGLGGLRSVRARIVESLVSGAESIRAGYRVPEVDGPRLVRVARMVAHDEELLRLEGEYWDPLLDRARAEGVLIATMTNARAIRWFMTCQYLVAAEPDMVGEDIRAWIVDFVVPPVLNPTRQEPA